MAVDGERWRDVKILLERTGPLSSSDGESADELLEYIRSDCRVLVIGAGGLGCELLKNLALSGFGHIDVIDMDTIDVSNLNRQFLFRTKDVGRPKAKVAAEFISERINGVKVTPHFCAIQDKPAAFYRSFNIVIAGLDSAFARRWINNMIVSLVELDDDGNPNPETIIPLIDGGTESLLGHVRVIIPRMSPCFECSIDLFPPQTKFQLCTIAETPRIPEHCIAYASEILWDRRKPFGESCKMDTDSADHMRWIYEEASKRADQFGIAGVSLKLTLGVVKNIVPAVASTNAIIAAGCVNEALKIVTQCAPFLKNYMLYNGSPGVYTYATELERRPGCSVCGASKPHEISMSSESTLEDLLDYLKTNIDIQADKPMLSIGGRLLRNTTVPALEESTRPNLGKSLGELFAHGTQLQMTDAYDRELIILFTDAQN